MNVREAFLEAGNQIEHARGELAELQYNLKSFAPTAENLMQYTQCVQGLAMGRANLLSMIQNYLEISAGKYTNGYIPSAKDGSAIGLEQRLEESVKLLYEAMMQPSMARRLFAERNLDGSVTDAHKAACEEPDWDDESEKVKNKFRYMASKSLLYAAEELKADQDKDSVGGETTE